MRVILTAATVLAAYWAALVVGVDSVLITHWAYLALHIAFVAPVLALEDRPRDHRAHALDTRFGLAGRR